MICTECQLKISPGCNLINIFRMWTDNAGDTSERIEAVESIGYAHAWHFQIG